MNPVTYAVIAECMMDFYDAMHIDPFTQHDDIIATLPQCWNHLASKISQSLNNHGATFEMFYTAAMTQYLAHKL